MVVVGFVFLLMELVWYWMFVLVLGGLFYIFGLIFVVVFLGIGVGSLFYFWCKFGLFVILGFFVVTCVLEVLFLGVLFWLGDGLVYFVMILCGLGIFGFGGLVFGWILVIVIVVLFGVIVLGY